MFNRLRSDPASHISAAIEDWEHPISREALIAMDQFDLDLSINSKKKPAPHPGRPWKSKRQRTEHHGDAGGRSPAEVMALLRPSA